MHSYKFPNELLADKKISGDFKDIMIIVIKSSHLKKYLLPLKNVNSSVSGENIFIHSLFIVQMSITLIKLRYTTEDELKFLLDPNCGTNVNENDTSIFIFLHLHQFLSFLYFTWISLQRIRFSSSVQSRRQVAAQSTAGGIYRHLSKAMWFEMFQSPSLFFLLHQQRKESL